MKQFSDIVFWLHQLSRVRHLKEQFKQEDHQLSFGHVQFKISIVCSCEEAECIVG
jgi:hypothetical protein